MFRNVRRIWNELKFSQKISLLIVILILVLAPATALIGSVVLNVKPRASEPVTPPITLPITPTPAAAIRVFVTSTSYNGNLGGLSGADAKCQERANAANLNGTWKAFLSTQTSPVDTRLTHFNGPYIRLDGVQIADNWTSIFSNLGFKNSLNLTELKTQRNGAVWTGGYFRSDNSYGPSTSNFDGSSSCKNWTSAVPYGSSGSDGYIGVSNSTGTSSIGNGTVFFCYNTTVASLYCFEQVNSPSPTTNPNSSTFSFNVVPSTVNVNQQFGLQWGLTTKTGYRVDFKATIPPGIFIPGDTNGCQNGLGCTHINDFPNNPPGTTGFSLYGYSKTGGTYNFSTTFTESQTNNSETLTTTLNVIPPSPTPTSIPTSTPTPTPVPTSRPKPTSPLSVNLIPNGGFETWTGGIPDNWLINRGLRTSIYQVTDNNISGNNTIEIRSQNTWVISKDFITVTPGTKYQLSLWVKNASKAGPQSTNAIFGLVIYNSSGKVITTGMGKDCGSYSAGFGANYHYVSSTNTWLKYSSTCSLPTNAAKVKIKVGRWFPSTDYQRFDNIELKKL